MCFYKELRVTEFVKFAAGCNVSLLNEYSVKTGVIKTFLLQMI